MLTTGTLLFGRVLSHMGSEGLGYFAIVLYCAWIPCYCILVLCLGTLLTCFGILLRPRLTKCLVLCYLVGYFAIVFWYCAWVLWYCILVLCFGIWYCIFGFDPEAGAEELL